jgi:RNA polymerase sigma factor (sigma-70 family)
MRSDAELLFSRDPEDFGVFYERHVAGVTAYVGRRSPSCELTFDLVAETFARALVHRDRFDPRRGPAMSWLFGIARNLMTDAGRHGRVADATRRALAMEPVALDDEQRGQVTAAGAVDLETALAQLPESQRMVALRRVFGEDEYMRLPGSIECSGQIARALPPRGLAKLRRRAAR